MEQSHSCLVNALMKCCYLNKSPLLDLNEPKTKLTQAHFHTDFLGGKMDKKETNPQIKDFVLTVYLKLENRKNSG